jgi:hypothetical protein
MNPLFIAYLIIFIIGIIIYNGGKDIFIKNKNVNSATKHSSDFIRVLKIIGGFLIFASIFLFIGYFVFGG